MLNPLELAPAQLRQLSPETLDRYARGATGKMARLRVFLGQVLLAMDDTDAHDHFGCHSSAHYAEAILRMDGKSAQRLRRIAIRLETLPVLSEAVANGTIAWSSLRAILPLCDEGNEAEWLRRAQQLTSRELEAALRFQRSGGASADPRQAVELTFHVSPETAALLEWANRDIRVNAVAPGWTRTEMVAGGIKDGRLSEAALTARIPQQRLAEPSEIAKVVLFLMSADSSYITGQTLVVDGGYTAW